MKFLGLIKWIRGFVKVEAFSDNASAFLSFLASRGVTVNNVSRKNDRILFEIPLEDYKKIRLLRGEFGRKIKIRHTALCGMPRKMQILLKRKSIAVGFVLFFAVLLIFSRFIWKIEIVGNDTVSDAEIVSAYTELGVFEGMPKFRFDSYRIRDKFTLKLEKVSWCSFNLEGSVLTINISEVKESDKAGKLTHSNIVAECDGIIKMLDIKSGYTKVKVGEVVSRGEVLVSGAPEYGGVFTWSDGEVLAETEHSFKIKVPKQYEKITVLEKNATRLALDVFGLKLPLYLDGIHFESIYSTRRNELRLFGESLPLAVVTRRFTEVEKSIENRSVEECENDSVALLLEICKERKTESLTILSREITEEADCYLFVYKCRLVEDIGEVRKINVSS